MICIHSLNFAFRVSGVSGREDRDDRYVFPPYDLVIVYESLQRAYKDCLTVLNYTAFSRNPYPQRSPKNVAIIAMQLGPSVRSHRPSPFTSLERYPFFKNAGRMCCKTASSVRGARIWSIYKLYRSLLTSTNSIIVTSLLNYPNLFIMTLYTTKGCWECMWSSRQFKSIAENLLSIITTFSSSQHTKLNETYYEVIIDAFTQLYKAPVRRAYLDEHVSIVLNSQGLENWLIIYTVGRVILDPRLLECNSIRDNFFNLYVVELRSKQHLSCVAGHAFIWENCRSRCSTVSVFRIQTWDWPKARSRYQNIEYYVL